MESNHQRKFEERRVKSEIGLGFLFKLHSSHFKLSCALTNWFGISSATVTPETCVSLQNKWERKESHLSPTTTQLKAEGLQPPVWKRSHGSLKKRKPWDSNPQRSYPQLFSRQCPHPAG